MTTYQAKDFIQTNENLVFAVVEQGIENGKVLCFLRYQRLNDSWKKLATQQANELLKARYPEYLYYSEEKSAYLHAVDVADIAIHHQPQKRLQVILAQSEPNKIEQDLVELCLLFQEEGVSIDHLGITGSLLIGAQNSLSDIDIVVYGRDNFHHLRTALKLLIVQGKLHQLDADAWLATYERRLCELDYSAYVWHEQRKYNKGLIKQRKFDLNLIEHQTHQPNISYQKYGAIVIKALVVDAQYAFDYPAKFILEHDKVTEVVCYTATYTGQAQQGEMIEVAGQLEVSNAGQVRVLVGSTREAEGEYIKVLNS